MTYLGAFIPVILEGYCQLRFRHGILERRLCGLLDAQRRTHDKGSPECDDQVSLGFSLLICACPHRYISRSIYDWDNSQSMGASSIDSPHSSELSRPGPVGWVTLPRRGAEHAAADAPVKPHRGMSNAEARPTNTEKRGSLPANNGGLSAHTSSNASRDEPPVSPAKEPSSQLTNGHGVCAVFCLVYLCVTAVELIWESWLGIMHTSER